MRTNRNGRGRRLAAGLLLAGLMACSSAPPAGPPGPEKSPAGPGAQPAEKPPAEPDLPVAEDTRERTQRLLRLEQACDQWHAAFTTQEYARMESLASVLRTYTRDHFDAIVSDLRHGAPRFRKTMAAALGFSGHSAAVPPLIEALKDQYYEVVLHSLFSIYLLAEPEGRSAKEPPIVVDPELLLPYLKHPRTDVRSNAALALSRVVKPPVSPTVLLALVSATDERDPATRVHIIAALGATREHEAFPHLVKALSDEVQLVRIRAVIALGLLQDPNAIPYLIEVLARKDEKPDVKRTAAKALGALLGERHATSIEPAFWQEKAAARGLPGAPGK